MKDSLAGLVEQQDRGQQFRFGGLLNGQEMPAEHRFKAIASGEFKADLGLPVPKGIPKLNGKWHPLLLSP